MFSIHFLKVSIHMVARKRYNPYSTLQHYSQKIIEYIQVIPYFYFKVTDAFYQCKEYPIVSYFCD